MSDVRSFLVGLPTRAKLLFGLGLLAILVVAGAGGWWALRPDYEPLAQNLRPVDASEIGTTLSGWGVPYRFDKDDKTILVPDNQVYALRMKLAAEGVPKGGSVGFEAFKDSDYGVTEFAQQVNYQRALQGELERTIESMREVQSARVHLAIHHAGLFDKDQDPSKGSVTLHLRPDAHLEAKQVVGIQRLVASAVNGLKPAAVTVLDQDGTVLSGSGIAGDGALVGDQPGEAATLEKALRAEVGDMLTRALHRSDFTVSVAVRLNYDRVKRVQEQLLTQGKDGRGVLVHEKTNSTRPSGSQGIDGSQGADTAGVTSRDVEYAHGTVQEEIEEAPGRIQRISVGVVIPGTLASADIKQLSDVIAAGIGLDASRGDRVDIAAVAPWVAPGNHVVATTVSANPSAAESAAPPKVGHAIAAPARIWNLPYWSYAAMGAGVLLLGMFVGFRIRPRQPRRLTHAERETALEQMVHWIEQSERVS